jgi:hypothetical protein
MQRGFLEFTQSSVRDTQIEIADGVLATACSINRFKS